MARMVKIIMQTAQATFLTRAAIAKALQRSAVRNAYILAIEEVRSRNYAIVA